MRTNAEALGPLLDHGSSALICEGVPKSTGQSVLAHEFHGMAEVRYVGLYLCRECAEWRGRVFEPIPAPESRYGRVDLTNAVEELVGCLMGGAS